MMKTWFKKIKLTPFERQACLTGSLVVILGTLLLIALNWGAMLYAVFLSIALGGAVTAVVSTGALLKEEQFQSHFEFSIPFDTETKRLPLIDLSQEGVHVPARLCEVMAFAQMEVVPPVKTGNTPGSPPPTAPPSPPPPPPDNAQIMEEAFRYGGTLLQYQLLRLLHRLQNRVRIASQQDTKQPHAETDHGPLDDGEVVLSSIVSCHNNAFLESISRNRFARSESEQSFWQKNQIYLPENTEIALYLKRASPGAYPCYGVRLSKPHFFDLYFTVVPVTATDPGFVPKDLILPEEERGAIQTLEYTIEMSACFHRLASGLHQTEEMKRWARWLFNEMKRSLANPLG